MAVLNYVVTASSFENVSVEAIVGGLTTTATVPRLVVEAVSSDASMGHMFRLGDDAQIEDFPVGQQIVVTILPAV